MQHILHKTTSGWQSTAKLKACMGELPAGRYMVTVHAANRRSLPQNAYYWAVVVPMVLDGLRGAGWGEIKPPEDDHDILKYRFLTTRMRNQDGVVLERIKSTSELSKSEFNEYLEQIAQWAAEWLGIAIPEPNQQLSLYESQ